MRTRSSPCIVLVLAATTAASALAGCGSDLVYPEHARHVSRDRVALLKRQPAPKCEYRTPGAGDSANGQRDGSPPPGDTDPQAALRIKLDYERQCYKHAEMITRARLTALQTVVERAGSHREDRSLQP